ncbi:ubiquitin-specific protease ubp15 [Talaromyces marneffei ATCC 18224]
MMKINDRHTFPMDIDLSPYLSDDADKSESWEYQLHGVLVHSGDFNAGHYYAFLKPTKDGNFYRFDDDKVIRATDKEVLEENYGGEYDLSNGSIAMKQQYARGLPTKRSMNAYMLVYIRKTRLDDVLLPITKENVPSHIETRLVEERAELARRRKEREEAHLYMNVGVLDDTTFQAHHGFDLTSSDLPSGDAALPKSYRILRTKKVSEFAQELAEEKGLNPKQVRLWVMVNRQNKTIRPDQVIQNTDMTMEEAWSRLSTKNNPLKVWMEVGELGPDGAALWPEAGSSVLIFLKHFDVPSQTLTGVGSVYVRKNQKVADLAPTILEKMGWTPGTEFLLFEEIKHTMVDPMKPKQTFQQSEIQDGDIITFQRSYKETDLPPTALYTETRQYYDYLLNRMKVKFAPLKRQGDEFVLTLSRKMTYDQFAKKVGEHLGIDYSHLRFCPVLATNGKPKQPIKRTINQTLFQILNGQYGSYGYSMHLPDALYYEVLDTNLSEYETKKTLKVTWLIDGINKETTYELLVPRTGTVSDVLAALQKKADFDDESMQSIRIYEAQNGKLHKELRHDLTITGLNEYVSLYAEKIPEEELNMQGDEHLITAFNFDREPTKSHGIPFKFVVKPGEIFKQTKERLSKRTGIKGKQFEKIKFAVVPHGIYQNPRYLEDDDILSDVATEANDTLGLDHVNKNRSFWRGETFSIK